MGATGAVGKEIMHFAKQNSKIIGEIILITRRKLDEWTDEEYWPIKLTFIYRESFDKLYYSDEEIMQLNGADAFICTLGAR